MSYDRISDLPDSLITQILLRLPTKVSVTTSVLSTRWRNQWLDVPGIDFNSDDLDCFSKGATNSFSKRFLELNREPHLQKFKVKFSEWFAYLFHIRDYCIATAVDNHETQQLPLTVPNIIAFMRVNIYKSKTLVSLTLQDVVAPINPDFVVSLPCLKIMHLENFLDFTDGPSFTEKLISCCPVLEDLNVVRNYNDFLKTMRVRSQSLKTFRLMFHPGPGVAEFEYEVEIDAPGLKYLSYKDNQSVRIVVKNLNSFLRIDIDTKFNVNVGDLLVWNVLMKGDLIREFLTGISKVKHMVISQPTLQVLCSYSTVGPIPKFRNLSHLQAAFSNSSLPLLPVFLESCSNLKTLIMDFCLPREPKQKINLTIVPQCLISTLESVEINNLYLREGAGMDLASYFLMNSVVLKTLNLNVSLMNNQEIDFYKSLFTLIKLSPKCQVFFDGMQLVMLGRK